MGIAYGPMLDGNQLGSTARGCVSVGLRLESWRPRAIRQGLIGHDASSFAPSGRRALWLHCPQCLGRYLVTGSVKNETFPTVIEPATPPGRHEEIIVGGQASRFPAEQIVTLEIALRAARAFYDSGRFEGGATWAAS